jgi:hypothetical protein
MSQPAHFSHRVPLDSRELGHFAYKGKQFDFIPTIYYTIFKENSLMVVFSLVILK